MTVSVRRLRVGESPTWRAAVERIIASEERDDALIPESDAEKALGDERCYMIVAEADATPVGLLSAYRFPDLEAGGQIVYLYDIEVDPALRRRGIGRRLIGTLLACCDHDAVDLIWAGTDASNKAARTLFDRTGAVLDGESYAEYEWDLEEYDAAPDAEGS